MNHSYLLHEGVDYVDGDGHTEEGVRVLVVQGHSADHWHLGNQYLSYKMVVKKKNDSYMNVGY